MKLLIVTQAVDLDDPVLGFFHSWTLEFSKHCESVHVICLKEGRRSLPANVFVHSLGKENVYRIPYTVCRIRLMQRILYALRFWRYIWKLRNEYDAVFVHMNQEYALMGGILWRLLRKKVVLWRNHKKGSVWTRVAGFISHMVCYTSPEAYVSSFKNATQMPIGIDTDFFKPGGDPDPISILFFGRLDAVKRPEVLLQALEILGRKKVSFKADIIGDPTPGREAFASELKKRFSSVPNVSFKPAVRNDEAAAVYNAHAIYVNLTPSGSFDKTIGEAMASGCVVIAANEVLREIIPDELLVDADSADSVAHGISFALHMDTQSREAFSKKSRAYVVREHSLSLLASRLFALYEPRA